MNKRIFALILCLTSLAFVNGQVVFSFSSDTISAPGETVDVDVIVESGFTDIVSFQLSLNWDNSVFTYSSIQDVTDVLPEFSDGNIGSPPDGPGVDDGELTLSWSRSSTQPASIPDGTKLFTLRLFGEGDLCSSTQVKTSNSPLLVEVINNDFDEVDVEESGGVISIMDSSCDGNGGGGDGVLLAIADLNASAGSSICIPITTENFDNIGSLQTGVTWDSDVLTYTGINDSGLTAVTANSNNAATGELIVLWLFDNEGVSLLDGSTLFELCFDIAGNTGESTEVRLTDVETLDIEVADIDGVSLDFSVNSGTFTVGSGPLEEGVGLIFPDVYTEGLSSICVPVTTRDFVNIAAIQGGVSFNTDVLTYTESREGAIEAQIGANNAADGELRVLWTVDLGSEAVTVPDGDVLFELCFDVVGNDGDVSDLSFINIPFLPIEIVNEDAQAEDFFVRDGSVTVGNRPGADVTLIASQQLADQGDTICVDISVEGFTNIDGMGFAIEWDADVVQYVGQQEFNLASLGNTSFNFESPDKLILLWAPTSSQTVADGTNIFQVCYSVVGDCGENLNSAISFVDGNTPIEVIDDNQQSLDVAVVNGSIAIDTCKGPSVDILSLVHPTCNGDQDGAITVDFKNTNGAVTCSWTDVNGGEITTTCNLVGVGGGVYTLSATDDDGTVLDPRTVTVINPDVITATANVTDISCDAPGALVLNVSGGTGGYSYNWTGGLPNSNSHTPIAGGTYEVTITDANMCTGTASATVVDNSFDLNPIVTDVTGENNGAIDLQPGATVDATYSWSNGATTSAITSLAIGDYTVTVTDDDPVCSAELTFTLTDGVLGVGDILDGINETYNGFGVSCNGEADGGISGTISGGCPDGPLKAFVDGTEVTVSDGGMVNIGELIAGEHILRIEDACEAVVEQTFTITEPDPIVTSRVTDVMCPSEGASDGALTLPAEGGVGTLTYTSQVGTVGANGRISNVPAGSFTVVVEDDNGCQLMVTDVSLNTECTILPVECVATSIISPNGDGQNDIFQIGCVAAGNNAPYQLSMYDRWGNLVFEADDYDNSWTGLHMDGTELPEGGYMWVLVTGGPGQREIFRETVSILR